VDGSRLDLCVGVVGILGALVDMVGMERGCGFPIAKIVVSKESRSLIVEVSKLLGNLTPC